MNVKSIGLGWITSAHLDKAKKFFQEDLGLEVTSDHPDLGWMELAPKDGKGMLLGVAQAGAEAGHRPGQNTVLTFTVDNLDDSIKELRAKGVTFEGDVLEVPGHVKMITFFDKDLNKFQLVEHLNGF